ncbi:MAG: hypothetical protein U0974_09130 [Gemmatimonadales bacterium]|nr:hypothetical protein [Gemmatimonadales bacterium]MDZ4389879.1 hypothetical protein [Gemmatimonadales bacterium]
MPNISVASRALRSLGDVGRFRFVSDCDGRLEQIQILDTAQGHGTAIGLYENPPGVDPEHVVVTDQALGCVEANQERWLLFDEIASTHGPTDKVLDDVITVVMKSGIRTPLRIAGGDGRFKDVFSFVRFIDRVMADRSSSG